jgi:hypothetical protein
VFQFYNLIPSLTVRENVELVTDIVPDPMPIGRLPDHRRPRASRHRAARCAQRRARGRRIRPRATRVVVSPGDAIGDGVRGATRPAR